MFWRKFKLDWHYAIGELVIVTLGVLVALAIQQWNENRLELEEEKEILDHLLIDLQEDFGRLEDQKTAVKEKEESLSRLRSVFSSGERPENLQEFLHDIIIGANYGWNQTEPRDTTYEEILSSGKFGLIRNATLRGAISDYQGLFNNLYIRADARETEFPHISYRLIPRSRESDRAGGVLGAEKEISNEEIEQLVDTALSSEIRDYVIAERNLARFILRQSVEVLEQHSALTEQIQGYRESLE